MRRKRLNITRRQGRLYFRRETARLSDGTPDGEILWVFDSDRRPRKAVPVRLFGREPPLSTMPQRAGLRELSILLGTYRLMPAVKAAKAIRDYMGLNWIP